MVEQRKGRRFQLRLPIELVRIGSLPIRRSAETRNLSSSGVLFASESKLPIGEAIEYVITLPVEPVGEQAVRLRCVGKVVRHEASASAATLERYEFLRN